MKDIIGFEISPNQLSDRIINIKIKDETIEKLIFPFKKFDLTAIEYKPFTRFTIAKSLDDLSQNQLSPLINKIEKITKQGCRVYSSVEEIPKTIGGLGTTILSTSKGVMSDSDARNQKLGGEVLISVF